MVGAALHDALAARCTECCRIKAGSRPGHRLRLSLYCIDLLTSTGSASIMQIRDTAFGQRHSVAADHCQYF